MTMPTEQGQRKRPARRKRVRLNQGHRLEHVRLSGRKNLWTDFATELVGRVGELES